eukprot:8574525-Alexandrium_andersonii.AAC.1
MEPVEAAAPRQSWTGGRISRTQKRKPERSSAFCWPAPHPTAMVHHKHADIVGATWTTHLSTSTLSRGRRLRANGRHR